MQFSVMKSLTNTLRYSNIPTVVTCNDIFPVYQFRLLKCTQILSPPPLYIALYSFICLPKYIKSDLNLLYVLLMYVLLYTCNFHF